MRNKYKEEHKRRNKYTRGKLNNQRLKGVLEDYTIIGNL